MQGQRHVSFELWVKPCSHSRFAAAATAKPIGGHVLAHASVVIDILFAIVRSAYYRSATRVMLRKGRGDERIAKLQDSPDQPEGEATYQLKSG